jgi:hypothetical protein
MITKAAFGMLLAAALVLSMTVIVTASPLGRSADTAQYNVAAEQMFEGIAARAAHSVGGVMYFTLKTADTDIEVELGPRDFIEKSAFKLKVGEKVTVVGARTMLQEREVLLAREVRSSRGVLIIRDRNGTPMWEPDRPIQMDPDRSESDLCEMITP